MQERELKKIHLGTLLEIDPVKTFECGQCFRWNADEQGDYWGVARGRAAKVIVEDDKVYIITSQEDYDSIWRDYLDMERDYESIRLGFDGGDYLSRCAEFGAGIRILRQERWEALCSFIISQNNNIPRIKGIIENMSKEYGTAIHEASGNTFYSFPTPKALLDAGEDKIFALKTGFRAKYIYDCARLIENGDINLDDIRNMPLELAGETLMKIKGVGPKVCACALLYGFGRYDAMPIDVWVKKILDKYYGGKVSENLSGKYAGIAQQYLFYHERCLNNVFI